MFENFNGYRHGKFHSHKPYGDLTKAEFKYDKLHGIYETYRTDGTLKRKYTYVDGKNC